MRLLILLFALLPASVAHAQSAAPDTLDLYGGPGTLEGKFQTATGDPDPQGWVGVDETAVAMPHLWNVSTYGAANLDPGVPDNHAWWCGDPGLPSCGGADPDGGYGNGWNTALVLTRVVDPTLAATVTLRGALNVDVEIGYDLVEIESIKSAGAVDVNAFDGRWSALQVNETVTYLPGEYVGDAGDEIQIRLHVTSDGAYSDEDCFWPTAGAVQADNLQLVIAQPGLPDDVGPVETCEPGDPTHWEPEEQLAGAGNFAQLWSGLDDLDPDRDNHSPQWAFIDDGLVVPGVGPTWCWVKCYGPDGLVVNHDARGDPPKYIANSILSPPIALPEDWTGTLRLAFDAYIDPAECFAVFVTWGMMATDDPTGLSGWSETWSDVLLYRSGAYGRFEFAVLPAMVPASSRFVRIKLQARQAGMMCWGPMDSPAPYLDNVRLQLGPLALSGVPGSPGAFAATAAPNPFNPAVVIRWNLPCAGDLSVRIHDARGRVVRTLRAGPTAAGEGRATWRGRDDAGQAVAAGVYFCRLRSGHADRILKVTLLK